MLCDDHSFPPTTSSLFHRFHQENQEKSQHAVHRSAAADDKRRSEYRIDIDSIGIGKLLGSRLHLQREKPRKIVLSKDPRIQSTTRRMSWSGKRNTMKVHNGGMSGRLSRQNSALARISHTCS